MSDRNTDDYEAEYDADDEYDADRDVHRNPTERGKWLSALIGLLGAWMILQVFLFDMVLSQFWNDIIVGALLLGVGGYNYFRRGNEEIGSVGAAAIAALLGLWLIAAPFLLGAEGGFTETTNPLTFWNDLVVGLIALGLGAYSAYAARDQKSDTRAVT